MKKLIFILTITLGLAVLKADAKPRKLMPWDHGRLEVSANSRYLQHTDGTQFFWLADTGWLLPERLNRDEAAYYLQQTASSGFNVVQVQTINDVPAYNCYGQSSMPGEPFDFSVADPEGIYSYWDHLDYIVETAQKNGIYVALVPIWGSLVKAGRMNVEQATAYGKFLGERYKDSPNIVWVIGGDVRGDVQPDVWTALAESIKSADRNHLMTFHPFGRTSSVKWWNDAPWLDFNMFQSGHRRYGQRRGDGDMTDPEDNEEDNWRYVGQALAANPLRPIIDGEPSYEDIPQGLHDPAEPRWTARDVRRYAYWSTFAGAAGHTYGNNSVMQFYTPGVSPAYGANRPWYVAIDDEGRGQMKYLGRLIMNFPAGDRRPDQSVIVGEQGERYGRLTALRGDDWLLVYDYSGRPMTLDLGKISGEKKHLWWYSPVDGTLTPLESVPSSVVTLTPPVSDNDIVLIATDAASSYLNPRATRL